MTNQFKNVLIGIFSATAIAIIIMMVLFLHPKVGDQGLVLRVRFTDIDKVNVGTRVLFAGKPVGEVSSIHVLDEVRKARIERKGDVYVYELDLSVDSSVEVYNTDRISLRTSGLLGEKSVSIDPEPPEPGQEIRIVNNEILYAEGVGSVEETFSDFKQVAAKFDLALDLVSETLQELRDRRLWENIANTADNLSELSTKFADNWSNIHDSITNVQETTANTKDISQMVKEGEGTMGRLLVKDDLYLQTSALLNKGETIMDDINHYGLLFHLDKGWQRMRARRLNLLNKLRTPQEFRNFFNDEIDQIMTSLSRVGAVMEKSDYYPNILQQGDFRKVFAELYRRVENLEEELKMYNIQLMEDEAKKTELTDRY